MLQIPKFVICFTLALAFAACAATERGAMTAKSESAANSAAPAGRNAGGAGEESKTAGQTVSLDQADKSKTAPALTERKIIRNATLILETTTPEDSGRKISQIVESKGGFVVTSDTKAASSAGGATTTTVSVVVRVPSAQFDAAVDEIRKTASRVVQEKVAGQDVTEEFIDLEARISSKKALEAQFLEIMKQSRSVADALEVQKQLATVRGEIESLEGRRKFLESQTSLSTITVTLTPPAVFAASSNGFFYQLGRAFSTGIDAALAIILFLITAFLAMLPIIILLGVPLWLLFRYLKKRVKRTKIAQQLAKEEEKAESDV